MAIKKYYKYEYEDWTQPILTANGAMGGNSFAVACDIAESSYPAYKAFNGSASDFCSLSLGNIDIYNPTKLNVTQIAIANRSDGDNSITGYTIYGSNDYSSWTSILTGTNDVISSGSNWNIDLSSNSNSYKFYRLAVTSANLSKEHLQVAEIALKAQEEKIVEVTADDDYDYYELVNLNYTTKRKTIKYYKDVTGSTSWTRPNISTYNTWGGDKFAVKATSENSTNYAWKAFDGSDSTHGQCKATSGTFSFYNPVPLNVTQLNIVGYNNDWRIQNCTFSGSNDDIHYEVIATHSPYFKDLVWNTPNDKFFKYFKIDWQRYGSYGLMWKELKITATQQTVETTDATSDGYYQQDGKWENPKLTVSLTTNLVELIWNTDKGEYTTYVSSNGFSKAAVNDLLYQYTADGVSVQNPEFLVRKIGDSSTNALSYRLESQIYAVPEIIPNTVKRKTREYYKTVSNMTDWVQPVLTSNGTMGGDSFAVYANVETDLGFGGGPSYVYGAFDGNVNTGWMGMGTHSSGKIVSWYNPVDLNISSIEIKGTSGQDFDLQYSNDNSDWKTVKTFNMPADDSYPVTVIDLSSDNISAKYWRIYNRTTTYSSIIIVDIKITAQTGTTTTIEGTADDYDFYEDKIKTYTIRR